MANHTSKLVTAILTKNEANRYLPRVLDEAAKYSNRILVLDDNSDDNTCETALYCPKVTLKRRKAPKDAWGDESNARAELWEEGARLAGDGWLLICDSDMILHGDPRPLCLSWEATSWSWTLRDLWDGEDTFRVDGPWSFGSVAPRPWLFKPSACKEPKFSGRGIHSLHAPLNFPGPCFPAPNDIFWLHYAYQTKENRTKKYAQYQAVASQLTPFEQQHAQSIAD